MCVKLGWHKFILKFDTHTPPMYLSFNIYNLYFKDLYLQATKCTRVERVLNNKMLRFLTRGACLLLQLRIKYEPPIVGRMPYSVFVQRFAHLHPEEARCPPCPLPPAPPAATSSPTVLGGFFPLNLGLATAAAPPLGTALEAGKGGGGGARWGCWCFLWGVGGGGGA